MIQQTLWDSLEHCLLQVSGLAAPMSYSFCLQTLLVKLPKQLGGGGGIFTYFYSKDLEVFLMWWSCLTSTTALWTCSQGVPGDTANRDVVCVFAKDQIDVTTKGIFPLLEELSFTRDFSVPFQVVFQALLLSLAFNECSTCSNMHHSYYFLAEVILKSLNFLLHFIYSL